MLTSSTLTLSIGSGERKRSTNIAPVRRLRSLAWMKARRLPGVRCSTLKTECRSSLCLMIMPGRSWVAGIAIAGLHLLLSHKEIFWAAQRETRSTAARRVTSYFTYRNRCLAISAQKPSHNEPKKIEVAALGAKQFAEKYLRVQA